MKGLLRSATLIVGLLLAAGAFIAYLALGNVMNPAPYQVVVALQDIPRYTTVAKGMLAVDAQHVHENVARGYVLKEELDDFLGAVAIEPIHAGEPLSKMRLVTGGNAMARKRLSLALEDESKVAMVIPVEEGRCPEAIYPGDYVNVIFGVGNVPSAGGRAGEEAEGAALSPLSVSALHPYLRQLPPVVTSTQEMSPSTSLPGQALLPEEMSQGESIALVKQVMLPLAKAIVRDVPILNVRREMMVNPQYAAGAREDAPAYVEGPIRALDVLIPAEAQETLAFAIENGSLHITLLPLLAHDEEEDPPTLGMTWQDMLDLFYQERLVSIQQMAQPVLLPAEVTTTVGIAEEEAALATEHITATTPLTSPGGARHLPPTATPLPPRPTPTPVSKISPGSSLASTGQGIICLTAGVGLIVVVGAIIYLIKRKRR